MTDAERYHRWQRFPPAAFSLLVLLAAMIALAAVWGVAGQRDDLTARAQLALHDAGFDGVSVEVAGRDLALEGAVASESDAEAARALVLRLEGVRRVDRTGVTISGSGESGDTAPATSAPPAAQGAVIVIVVENGRVTVTGTAPSAEPSAVLGAVLPDMFPGAQVIDGITVSNDVASPEWLGELPAIVRALEGVESGTVSISDDGIVADGFAADVATAETIDASLRRASTLAVETAFLPLADPHIIVVAGGDAVALEGALARQADVDAVVEGAKARFAAVDSALTAGGVRRPDWGDDLPGIFGATAGWTQWRLEIDGNDTTFSGLAPSTQALVQIRDGYLAELGTAGVTFEVEVAPDALAAELTDVLAGSTTFVSGSAELSSEAETLLDQVIVMLAANPSARITVEGHTDDQGSAAGNVILSEARAQAVVDYLVAGGVDAARLRAAGYGEDRPIADNGTADGRAQNRRIVFVVETEGDS